MKRTTSIIPQEAEEMNYHEHLDYWVCKCGTFEKLDGFNASDHYGNLIIPIGASYHRCEHCGRVIHAKPTLLLVLIRHLTETDSSRKITNPVKAAIISVGPLRGICV